MAVYYRRSIVGRIIAVLVGIVVLAFAAHLVNEWLVPFLPLLGGVIMAVGFGWFAFRRRR